jgi:ERCC4-type nuclease
MIHIDHRVGSAELAKYFVEPIEVGKLMFGDFAFIGRGPDGPVHIGIERKHIRDLIDSVKSGRLWGHQIPGMLDVFDYSYLVIEGVFKMQPEYTMLPVGNRWIKLKIGSKVLDPFLNSVQVLTGMMIHYTMGKKATAQYVESLYRWWGKNFGDHGAYGPYMRSSRLPEKCTNGAMVYMMARCLPGVGVKKAESIRQHFSSVVDMVNAPAEEWLKIPEIGKSLTSKIQEAIGLG